MDWAVSMVATPGEQTFAPSILTCFGRPAIMNATGSVQFPTKWKKAIIEKAPAGARTGLFQMLRTPGPHLLGPSASRQNHQTTRILAIGLSIPLHAMP
jgi:hypothetical protein